MYDQINKHLRNKKDKFLRRPEMGTFLDVSLCMRGGGWGGGRTTQDDECE
jgi:hypothetical protein